MARGNEFIQVMKDSYDYNEVHLTNGKRLDSYDPINEEIISRKATDLDNISESTYRRYLSEFDEKYANGVVIRSNKYPDIDGTELNGNYILEIPKSNQSLQDIDKYIKIAEEYGVTIRFSPETGIP